MGFQVYSTEGQEVTGKHAEPGGSSSPTETYPALVVSNAEQTRKVLHLPGWAAPEKSHLKECI